MLERNKILLICRSLEVLTRVLTADSFCKKSRDSGENKIFEAKNLNSYKNSPLKTADLTKIYS